MTALFVPGAPAGQTPGRAYDELCDRVSVETGRAIRGKPILGLNARRQGVDSWTRVGEPDPDSGVVVRAILPSRGGYTVVCGDGHTHLPDRLVYEAVRFE